MENTAIICIFFIICQIKCSGYHLESLIYTEMGTFKSLEEVERFYDMIIANKRTNRGPRGTCVEYGDQYGDQTYIQTSRSINGRKIHCRVHKAALLKKIRQISVPEGLEASHLCHNKRCMEPNHIVAEPHWINMTRTTCAYMRETIGDPSYCNGNHEGYERCL